ncbi:hypothetical protein [Tenacibaculum xiamenense]|uniref:hypothetical protein n=1 Tax=Tenacibaculum xiamenense TaxID=1261553 RepID=UPI003894384E
MSEKKVDTEAHFGDAKYDYRQVKVGDKDAQGEVILSVFYTTKKMIIYRTKGNLIVSYSDYSERFSVLNAKKQEINNLIHLSVHQERMSDIKSDKEKGLEDLRAFYSPQLAHAYQMCYLEKYEEAVLIAENVRKGIENKITSKAQYTYFEYYLKYLSYIFIALVAVVIWSTFMKYENYEIHYWFVWHFYIGIAGVIGSFISAKEKVASRTVDFNIPVKRTIIDVKFRLLLGGIFGVLTVWLVYSNILTGIFTTRISDTLFLTGNATISEIITVLIIAVVGGFSERLVPDTLGMKSKKNINKTEENDQLEKAVAEAVARGQQ